MGFDAGFNTDLSAYYQIWVLQWLKYGNGNWIYWQPNLEISLKANFWVAIKLYWIEWYFFFDAYAIRFNPIDYHLLISMDDSESYC